MQPRIFHSAKQISGFQGTKGKAKREETFSNGRFVRYLDCGDIFMNFLYIFKHI